MKKILMLVVALMAVGCAVQVQVGEEWDGVSTWVRTGGAHATYDKMLVIVSPSVDAFTWEGRIYPIPQSFNSDGSMFGVPAGNGSNGRWFYFSAEKSGGGHRCWARWGADAFLKDGKRVGHGEPREIGFDCRPGQSFAEDKNI